MPDKAKVEVAVQVVERWVLAKLRHRRFFSLGELNAAIGELIDELNARTMRRIGSSRRALFEAIERRALQPLPAEPFEYAEWKRCRAGLDYHIEVHGHWYSVPPVQRQSRWMPYCLIQECSRDGRALPHQNAPDAASVCQSTRERLCRLNRLPVVIEPPRRREPNRLFCSIGEPAFPSRPGAAQATARSGGDWEEQSHPQPRTARCCARAWRAPDLP